MNQQSEKKNQAFVNLFMPENACQSRQQTNPKSSPFGTYESHEKKTRRIGLPHQLPWSLTGVAKKTVFSTRLILQTIKTKQTPVSIDFPYETSNSAILVMKSCRHL